MFNPFKKFRIKGQTAFEQGFRFSVHNEITGFDNCFKTKEEAEAFVYKLKNPFIEEITK
jgi:hypothetical protein